MEDKGLKRHATKTNVTWVALVIPVVTVLTNVVLNLLGNDAAGVAIPIIEAIAEAAGHGG